MSQPTKIVHPCPIPRMTRDRKRKLEESANSINGQPPRKKVKQEKPKKRGRRSREESSLRSLAKKFVALINKKDDGILDLNESTSALGVAKRRIYDITNVLEGIGLIEKKTKNCIQWKGAGLSLEDKTQCKDAKKLKEEVETMERTQKHLELKLKEKREAIHKLSQDKKNFEKAFVTYGDICELEKMQNRTIIAIKAPPHTTLTVPDPDEGLQAPQRRYQIFLNAEKGPIRVFLLSDEGEEGSPGHVVDEDSKDLEDGDTIGMAESLLTPALPTPGLTEGLASPELLLNTPKHDLTPGEFQTPNLEFRTPGKGEFSTPGSRMFGSTKKKLPTSGSKFRDSPNLMMICPPEKEPDYLFSFQSNEGISDLFMEDK